jgi:hypothetical protein
VGRVGSDGGAKGLGRFSRLVAGQQVKATVGEHVGGVRIVHSWL